MYIIWLMVQLGQPYAWNSCKLHTMQTEATSLSYLAGLMKNEESTTPCRGQKAIKPQPNDSLFNPYCHLQKALLLPIRVNVSRFCNRSVYHNMTWACSTVFWRNRSLNGIHVYRFTEACWKTKRFQDQSLIFKGTMPLSWDIIFSPTQYQQFSWATALTWCFLLFVKHCREICTVNTEVIPTWFRCL